MEKARENKKNRDLTTTPQKTKKDGATHMNNQNNRIKMVGQDITKIKFKDAISSSLIMLMLSLDKMNSRKTPAERTFVYFLLSTSLHTDLHQRNNEFTTSIKIYMTI